MQLAPIVLFVYNRPWHTRQTLEALAVNKLADQSELFVFADGPKLNASPEDIARIIKVRGIIKEKQWCKSIKIIESEINKGLADSIISGVTRIVNEYGKIIVLEDDIVTSPGFLKYMNDALNLYSSEVKVMHVSGYMFPVKKKLPQTFFYNSTSCWGWGTWARAWKYFDKDAKKLSGLIYNKGLIKKFNIQNSYPFYSHLEDNVSGKLNTWAIKWYASVFLESGFALHPYPSLTNNIGHDSSGVHCSNNNKYHWEMLAKEIFVKKTRLKERSYVINAMAGFNLNRKHIRLFRFKKLLKSRLKILGIFNHSMANGPNKAFKELN